MTQKFVLLVKNTDGKAPHHVDWADGLKRTKNHFANWLNAESFAHGTARKLNLKHIIVQIGTKRSMKLLK